MSGQKAPYGMKVLNNTKLVCADSSLVTLDVFTSQRYNFLHHVDTNDPMAADRVE